MDIYEAIEKRRTVRRFKQEKIDKTILEALVNYARLAPSSANQQPLKYIIVDENKKTGEVFDNVKWAGYIAPEGDPPENERPVAYIIVLGDTKISKSGWEHDVGAAVQNILLAASAKNIGTCWIGSINRDEIRKALSIPGRYIIDTLVALGYEAERPVAEDERGSIKYYKDEKGKLHVPKRKLEDIIIK